MNIELRSIIGRGELKNERITFRAKSAADIGDYVLLQTGSHDGEVTTEVENAFWFPYQKVEKGDIIVLYTRRGASPPRKLSTGKSAYFFYFEREHTIWDEDSASAVLLHAPRWQGQSARELTK
ncbi:MAG: hypothetical protein V7664_08155 [Qipengyuania sp.]|uniref:hypothetical protein n=1 Tax=Qipengyuania sp. TaxID=2004515 RepID=UPI0030032804